MRNQTLRAAGRILLDNGFARGKYFRAVMDPGGWRPPRECPVCPRGAIAIAVGVVPDFMVPFEEPGLTVPENATTAVEEIREAERRLRLYLVVELGYLADAAAPDGAVITDWADDPERTQQEAIGACNAAAEYEERAA